MSAIHNEHSLVRNNLADYLVEWNLKDRIDGITAKMDRNVHGEGSVRRLLRAPDIGAYEFGAKAYWITGCTLPQASSPVPVNDATAVKVDADLMWLRGREAVAHTVYFADSAAAVKFVSVSSK